MTKKIQQRLVLWIGIPAVVVVFFSGPLYRPSRIPFDRLAGVLGLQALVLGLYVAGLYKAVGEKRTWGIAVTFSVLGCLLPISCVGKIGSRQGTWNLEIFWFTVLSLASLLLAAVFWHIDKTAVRKTPGSLEDSCRNDGKPTSSVDT